MVRSGWNPFILKADVSHSSLLSAIKTLLTLFFLTSYSHANIKNRLAQDSEARIPLYRIEKTYITICFYHSYCCQSS